METPFIVTEKEVKLPIIHDVSLSDEKVFPGDKVNIKVKVSDPKSRRIKINTSNSKSKGVKVKVYLQELGLDTIFLEQNAINKFGELIFTGNFDIPIPIKENTYTIIVEAEGGCTGFFAKKKVKLSVLNAGAEIISFKFNRNPINLYTNHSPITALVEVVDDNGVNDIDSVILFIGNAIGGPNIYLKHNGNNMYEGSFSLPKSTVEGIYPTQVIATEINEESVDSWEDLVILDVRPDINVVIDNQDITNNSTYDFGITNIGEIISKEIYIENIGDWKLILGNPSMSITGEKFSISEILEPGTIIDPNIESEVLSLQFSINTLGSYSGQLKIFSNDIDENPYIINLLGEVSESNEAPYITNVVFHDNPSHPNETLYIEVEVEDPNGIDDINNVNINLADIGGIENYELFDNGNNILNDGIFSRIYTIPATATAGDFYPEVIVTDDGLLSNTSNNTNLQILECIKEWKTVGTEGFSNSNINYTDIQISQTNEKYVVYQNDILNGGGVEVMKFDGINWFQTGNTIENASFPSLALGEDEKIYLSYTYLSSIYIVKFDGVNWILVGESSSPNGSSSKIIFDNENVPYIFYVSDSNKASVRKFNGTDWILIGNENFSEGTIVFHDIIFDSNNIPYVTYRDESLTSEIVVKKFTGSYWENIGENISLGQISFPTIRIDSNNTLYISYIDWENNHNIIFKFFDGNYWNTLGYNNISNTTITSGLDFEINKQGTIYVMYGDDKANIKKLDNNYWVSVGQENISQEGVLFTGLTFDKSGIPYIGYRDEFNDNKISVKMLKDCQIHFCKVSDKQNIEYDETTPSNNNLTYSLIITNNTDDYLLNLDITDVLSIVEPEDIETPDFFVNMLSYSGFDVNGNCSFNTGDYFVDCQNFSINSDSQSIINYRFQVVDANVLQSGLSEYIVENDARLYLNEEEINNDVIQVKIF